MTRSLAAAALIALAAASGPAAGTEDHACVYLDGCGCSLLVDRGSCPSGSGHFVHALFDGAPLQFRPARSAVVIARSLIDPSHSFIHQSGDAWVEHYEAAFGTVELRYRPAASTCVRQDEPCEYFDVEADVLVLPIGQAPYALHARGFCGC